MLRLALLRYWRAQRANWWTPSRTGTSPLTILMRTFQYFHYCCCIKLWLSTWIIRKFVFDVFLRCCLKFTKTTDDCCCFEFSWAMKQRAFGWQRWQWNAKPHCDLGWNTGFICYIRNTTLVLERHHPSSSSRPKKFKSFSRCFLHARWWPQNFGTAMESSCVISCFEGKQ